MSGTGDLIDVLLEAENDLLDALLDLDGDSEGHAALYALLGASSSQAAAVSTPNDVASLRQRVASFLEQRSGKIEDWAEAIDRVVEIARAVREIVNAARALDDIEGLEQGGLVGSDLAIAVTSLLLMQRLRRRAPWLEPSLELLEVGADAWRIGSVVSYDARDGEAPPPPEDPECEVTEGEVRPDELTEAEVRRWSNILFRGTAVVAGLLRKASLGPDWIRVHYGLAPEPVGPIDPPRPDEESLPSVPPPVDAIADRVLTLVFEGQPGELEEAESDELSEATSKRLIGKLSVALVPKRKRELEPPPGCPPAPDPEPGSEIEHDYDFMLAVGGDVDMVRELSDDWNLRLEVRGPVVTLLLRAFELDILDAATDVGIYRAALEQRPESTRYALGRAGTRLELGAAFADAELTVLGGPAAARPRVRIGARDSELVLGAGDRDGFLDRVLPDGETRIGFDLVLVVELLPSGDLDCSFEGGAGLSVNLPMALDLGGVLGVKQIGIGLSSAEGRRGWVLELTASVQVTIGRLRLLFERLGLKVGLSSAPAQSMLETMRGEGALRLPDGVGLAFGVDGLGGAAFLRREPDRHRYIGAGSADLGEGVVLNLLGYIVTEGEEKGSALLVGGVSGLRIELPLDITLVGAGVVFALDRRFDVEAAVVGLREGRLDALLAGDQPLEAAPAILAGLDALLPYREGEWVLGFVFHFVWGPRDYVKGNLAFVFDSDSEALVVLANLRARRRIGGRETLRINTDLILVAEFSPCSLRGDGSVYDTKILALEFEGDLAFRMSNGEDRTWLLSVGGFHPDFQVPEGVSPLRRVSVSIPGNAFLSCDIEAYAAIACGTLQFGGRIELFVGVRSVLGIELVAGVDVLWDPGDEVLFDLDLSVSLMRGRTRIASARLIAKLGGNAPWRCEGFVRFHVLWWDCEYPFDRKLGEDEAVGRPPVDLSDLVATALKSPASWGPSPISQLGSARASLVHTGDARPATGIAIDPGAPLAVRQLEAPLGITLDHLGGAPIEGRRRVSIESAELLGDAGGTLDIEPVLEPFAMPFYLTLSDEDALARPGFESMEAGVEIGASQVAAAGALAVDLGYETVAYGRDGAELDLEGVDPQPRPDWITRAVAHGATTLAAASDDGFPGPPAPVRVRPPDWTVVAPDTGPAALPEPRRASYSAVRETLERHLAAHPDARRDLALATRTA